MINNSVIENLTSKSKSAGKDKATLNITPLRQAVLTVPIVGTTPLKILRFSQKKQDQIAESQKAGSQAKSKKKFNPKDFNQDYEDAKYICNTAGEDWLGLNATGIRNACIETCRVAGFVMTKAKMSIFCIADGYDILDNTPLVRIYGTPEPTIDPVRNASGVIDLRARVMFKEWRMYPRIRFDEDQFSYSDIINLMIRVGQQNGLGEGRPNSSNGNGTGNGIFTLDMEDKQFNLQRLDSNPLPAHLFDK